MCAILLFVPLSCPLPSYQSAVALFCFRFHVRDCSLKAEQFYKKTKTRRIWVLRHTYRLQRGGAL